MPVLDLQGGPSSLAPLQNTASGRDTCIYLPAALNLLSDSPDGCMCVCTV